MKQLCVMIKRNVKLFFKDKGMLFTSLITPVILLILYVTFLGNVYKDSFALHMPAGVISDRLMNGLVGGQLISSILAVSCVTVAFCSNFLMVQDKANGSLKDMLVSPVKPAAISLSYYVASLTCTLIICFSAALICFVYIAIIGWYMTVSDVLLIILDIILLVLFGTALSSVINFFLSSLGQISAVGTIVSSGYGFISGAYMPISSFAQGLQNAIAFFPGTYGTVLLRRHALGGAIAELSDVGVSDAAINELMDAIDCNIYFFDIKVETPIMYLILCGAIAVLISIYVLLNAKRKKNK